MDATREILICTAVELEAKAIARRLRLVRSGRGLWGQGAVVLANVGIGVSHPDRARRNASLLIGAGLGGALDPQLKVGDVVVDDPDAILPVGMEGVLHGPIHTTKAIVATTAEKAALFSQTGAIAVDMETDILRALAREVGAKFVAVRAISDRADETLDPVMARIVDDEGRPKVWTIARELTRRPGLGAELRRIGRTASLAADQLAAVVEAICQAWQGQDASKETR